MAGGGTVDCTYTNHINLSPSIATTLSAETIPVGGTVHDSATLTEPRPTRGDGHLQGLHQRHLRLADPIDAGTKTVTNGVVPDSDPITFNTAGDYYWQAVYSGDANNNAATSLCTSEHLVVNKADPSIATTLSAETITVGGTVHDSATLTGPANAGGRSPTPSTPTTPAPRTRRTRGPRP